MQPTSHTAAPPSPVASPSPVGMPIYGMLFTQPVPQELDIPAPQPATASTATASAPATDTPHTPRPGNRNFAVYRLELDRGELPGDFVPKKLNSPPPLAIEHLPHDVLMPFAVSFNRSEHARAKRQWACVVNGGVFFVKVPDDQRPADPTAYPPGAQNGLTSDEAFLLVQTLNAPIRDVARVPRTWNVMLTGIH